MAGSDLDLLTDAGRQAGEIAMRYFHGPNRNWTKSGDSPVSEADIEVDRFLNETLMQARPGYGWLSEETADNEERLSRERIFVVDPIDGTRGFLKGDPHWCVSIAVVANGRPEAAVLVSPAVNRMLSAAQGSGALMNGEALQIEAKAGLSKLTGSRRLNEAMGKLYEGRYEILPFIPSLAYRIAMAATGETDAAFARSGAHEWDVAAAHLILEEAGGRITTQSGKDVAYNAPAIRMPALVAAGPGRHEMTLELAKQGGFLQ